MSHKLLTLALVLSSGTAIAEAPSVTADIAPVHSLVSQVMNGVGTPDLIVDPGASPHGYQLRPSNAAALQEAEIVFWIGEGLTPWLEGSLETLSGDAIKVELLEVEGLALLDNRDAAIFDDHHDDHHDDEHAEGHHDDNHDEGKHDAHGEDGHKDDHAEHDDHHGHDHGAHDPHAWLSPKIASVWLGVIAETLSEADPENADRYRENAAAAQLVLKELGEAAEAELAPLRGKPFIVFHDAYQYFEVAFDIPSAGAILIGDAADPSPARISEIQEHIREDAVACALAEPQFNPNLLDTVIDGTSAKTGIIDPLGAALTPGPDLYPTLIQNMVTSLRDCLS